MPVGIILLLIISILIFLGLAQRVLESIGINRSHCAPVYCGDASRGLFTRYSVKRDPGY